MRRIARSVVSKLPFVQHLVRQVQAQGAYPDGHFYSPVPSADDVASYVRSRRPPADDIPGIDINQQGQREWLREYADLYPTLEFPETQSPGHRYFYDNDYFSYSDAIFLYCFLCKHKPRRIVEIGSGFSSAVLLDTVDQAFATRPDITFIEPHPDRLMSLLRGDDQRQVRIFDSTVQEVPLGTFECLQSGDLLFIDSSHVVKCGSDLHFLFFDVLPLLQRGVFVHFHDVFYPFDYPSDWLLGGRYWNENYFLRAFLSWNTEWRIRFFNSYVHRAFGAFIAHNMPLCARNSGGSLYIQRARA